MRRFGSRLVLAIALAVCAEVQAQQPMQNLGQTPIIAGRKMQCSGAVTFISNMNDIAMATPGALHFRPDYFQLPPYIQWFIYAHECAHQIFGQDEAASDCWAVQIGKKQDWLPVQGINQICAYTFPSPGDWTHMPGPMRCQHMITCHKNG